MFACLGLNQYASIKELYSGKETSETSRPLEE